MPDATRRRRRTPAELERRRRAATVREAERRSLADLEATLALAETTEALFTRACLLDQLGFRDAARAGYLRTLRADAGHLGALANLGTWYFAGRQFALALRAFRVLLDRRPESPIAQRNIADAYLSIGDAAAARPHYERAVALAPGDDDARRGLAVAYDRLGLAEAARAVRAGLPPPAIMSLPYLGRGTPVRLLVLGTDALGNVQDGMWTDQHLFASRALIVERFAEEALPDADVVFNAIGDADLCAEALARARRLLATTSAPVLNVPAAVARTGRVETARRLVMIPGVRCPVTVAVARTRLAHEPEAVMAEHGLAWPVLLRSPGFHTGLHFVKIDEPDGFASRLADLPGEELFVMPFIDTRSAHDGRIRKYRAMSIDGALYPVHAAISERWKVHYFSADMADNAAHRAEDRAFLEAMPEVLGMRTYIVLQMIAALLGLDYGGIDFGIDPAGNVVVFEANAAMNVPLPAPDPRWDYRREPIARIHRAVREMLVKRAAGRTTQRSHRRLTS